LINAKESNLEILIQESTNWYWASNTQINSVAVGDVDGDDDVEIVTGGYFTDECKIAQLIVWDGETLALEGIQAWYWTGDTPINSVGVGNLDEDEALEIVTGGYYFDGFRKVAQLVVWDGATLAVEGLTTWYWTGDTEITSLKVEDIDGDGSAEIITGGYYNDGVRDIAQLVVWNGSTLSALRITGWYWTGNTRINDIDVKNLDDDLTKEIITAGYFTDECKIAQLIVWDGETLDVEKLTSWFWTNDTVINSVSCADIDSDAEVEIVTGGYYNDNNRDIAQLVIWNSKSMSVERLTRWYWTNDTRINSISIGDVDGDNSAEIITGGYFNDFSRDIAQLVVWDATALTADYLTSWYWTSDTYINSVNTANIDADVYSEIITGGKFYDSNRNCAQTTIWQIS